MSCCRTDGHRGRAFQVEKLEADRAEIHLRRGAYKRAISSNPPVLTGSPEPSLPAGSFVHQAREDGVKPAILRVGSSPDFSP